MKSNGLFLYEKIESNIKAGVISLPNVPSYVLDNTAPNFELRQYQKEALQYFIHYYEKQMLYNEAEENVHTLFHMATGAGKTLMMASLMLYLYKQGYRNFIFFVNSNNVVDKTKQNFLNPKSKKFLFDSKISIDNKMIKINEVNNFNEANEDDINIVFTTVQSLSNIFSPRENELSEDDFEDYKVVFISDESHHINGQTKNKSTNKSEKTWEEIIDNLFFKRADHILLEFTATCELENSDVLNKYLNKIVYNFPLYQYREKGYTKDFYNLQSNISVEKRIVQALLMNQYRLKLFNEEGVNIKPVVLVKSEQIKQNNQLKEEILKLIQSDELVKIIDDIKKIKNGITSKMFDFFDAYELDSYRLASELRCSFNEQTTIAVNGKTKDEIVMEKLNTLDEAYNPYRLIFAVNMLNEGWDVLNLYDIVRVNEKTGSVKATISEAQLIGRGARYCPFSIPGVDKPADERKFDNDTANELRVCETLYYHCKENSKYIQNLRDALKTTGFGEESTVYEYKVKESFKQTNMYKNGFLFRNEKILNPVGNIALTEVEEGIKNHQTYIDFSSQKVKEMGFFSDNNIADEDKTITTRICFKEIEYFILNHAIRQFKQLRFNNIKAKYKNVSSMREFLTSDLYLGEVELTIVHDGELTNYMKHDACLKALEELKGAILKETPKYIGGKSFKRVPLKEVVKDISCSVSKIDSCGGVGCSQNDKESVGGVFRCDLSEKDWFVYEDNFGTTEEKRFVAYFDKKIEELKRNYEEVYLIRNEGVLTIYPFDDGGIGFQPDYILMLKATDNPDYTYQQVFIEPKGAHLRLKDKWKEDFILSLDKNIEPVIYLDDEYCKIYGLPFYTHNENLAEFKSSFEKLYKK